MKTVVVLRSGVETTKKEKNSLRRHWMWELQPSVAQAHSPRNRPSKSIPAAEKAFEYLCLTWGHWEHFCEPVLMARQATLGLRLRWGLPMERRHLTFPAPPAVPEDLPQE